MDGLFFEVVLEHCLCICNRLPRPITLRFSPRDCGGGGQQQQHQQNQNQLTFDSFIPQPPTEIQVEAGAEVSLAADPSRVTVFFGTRVSRPVEIDYLMPGVRLHKLLPGIPVLSYMYMGPKLRVFDLYNCVCLCASVPSFVNPYVACISVCFVQM